MFRYNSTFKVKESSLRRVPGTARLNKVGPRTRESRRAWRFLKAEFEKRGITSCEFDFIEHECFGRLDPCHSKKRRLMQGDDIYAVALGCQQIHKTLDERMSHEQMYEAVMRVINSRGGMILP